MVKTGCRPSFLPMTVIEAGRTIFTAEAATTRCREVSEPIGWTEKPATIAFTAGTDGICYLAGTVTTACSAGSAGTTAWTEDPVRIASCISQVIESWILSITMPRSTSSMVPSTASTSVAARGRSLLPTDNDHIYTEASNRDP